MVENLLSVTRIYSQSPKVKKRRICGRGCLCRNEPVLCFVEDDNHMVTFYVKDFGIGIAEDRLGQIFDGVPYIGSAESDSCPQP